MAKKKNDRYDDYDEYDNSEDYGEYDDYEEEYEEDDYEEYSEDERAAFRHSRKMRNQLIAYIVLLVLILGILAGGYFGISALLDRVNSSKKDTQTVTESVEVEPEVQVIIESPKSE